MSQQLIEQTYDRLQTAQQSDLQIGSFVVHVARSADLQALYLATPIFNGGGYLPGSVRSAVSGAGLISSGGGIQAALVVDEEAGVVSLHYQVAWSERSPVGFTSIVEEFAMVAEEWERLLDEHGEQDLVWIPLS